MATVTHYIYSHYDPETAQKPEEAIDPEETWEQEAPRLNRLQGPAPHFVPASIPHDDWSSGQTSLSKDSSRVESTNALGTSLSAWYRSLRVSTPDLSAASSKKPHPRTTIPNTKIPTPVNKSNWFIMNAIQAEPSSSTSTPSLAEILDRDPPPLPSQKRYTPPVWLEIGPSNKGFGLLQRAGWNEGEALGPAVVRRKPLEHILPPDEFFETRKDKGKAKVSQMSSSSVVLRKETREVKLEDMDDVIELRQVDVIDLSMCSDDAHSDSDSSVEDGSFHEGASPLGNVQSFQNNEGAYESKALLTPIATVLKSDRLGIGLKAKTVGPYKASQRRVTHNAAALAAHIKMAEESKRRKELFGRGRRGLERQHRKENERRQAMIAYLKSS